MWCYNWILVTEKGVWKPAEPWGAVRGWPLGISLDYILPVIQPWFRFAVSSLLVPLSLHILIDISPNPANKQVKDETCASMPTAHWGPGPGMIDGVERFQSRAMVTHFGAIICHDLRCGACFLFLSVLTDWVSLLPHRHFRTREKLHGEVLKRYGVDLKT